ncbi:hypothetical protein M8J77_000544 [Diaphorina citri]|nr:hypothetical protein M8J77_000544 [Diaphorina citri]
MGSHTHSVMIWAVICPYKDQFFMNYFTEERIVIQLLRRIWWMMIIIANDPPLMLPLSSQVMGKLCETPPLTVLLSHLNDSQVNHSKLVT